MIERREAGTRDLRALLELGAAGGLSDVELLDRCTSHPASSGEVAFETLVGRHGGMVLDACRRVLDDPDDADDAFQATFLILARRAGSIRSRDSLASWLYGVAIRVSSNARRARARRTAHERRAARLDECRPIDSGRSELAGLISEELARLPDHFRAAVVLCDLEGLSHEEAARRLGCPTGTIKSRQARGRDRLRGSLTRRGLAPSAVALGLASIAGAGPSAVPASLARLMIRAASRVARGDSAAGIASAAAAELSERTLKAMLWTRLRTASAALLLLGTGSIGVGVASRASTSNPPLGVQPAPAAPPKPVVPEEAEGRRVLREAFRALKPLDGRSYNFYTLIELAKAQVRADDREGARETTRRAFEVAKAMEPAMKAEPILLVAWILNLAGDREGGLEALRLVGTIIDGTPGLSTPNRLREHFIAAQSDLGDGEGAKESIRRFRGLIEAIPHEVGQVDMERFDRATSLVRSIAYVGDFAQALELAEALGRGEEYYQGGYLGAIATGSAAEARFYLQPRRAVTDEARAKALVALRRIEEMAEKFEFAEERPDVDLAIHFARLGDFDSAFRAARRVGRGPIRHRHTIDLTAVPYALGCIGWEQGKAGHLEEARRTFREALDLITNDPNLATPIGRSRAFQVAEYQVYAGDLDGAMKTMEISPPEFRPEILLSIGKARGRAGDREGARSAFQLASREIDRQAKERTAADRKAATAGAESRSKNNDDGSANRDLTQIVQVRAGLGEFDAAIAGLAAIKDEDRRGQAVGVIAEARAAGGDAKGSLAWALSLEPSSMRVWALRGLAKGVRPVDE